MSYRLARKLFAYHLLSEMGSVTIETKRKRLAKSQSQTISLLSKRRGHFTYRYAKIRKLRYKLQIKHSPSILEADDTVALQSCAVVLILAKIILTTNQRTR